MKNYKFVIETENGNVQFTTAESKNRQIDDTMMYCSTKAIDDVPYAVYYLVKDDSIVEKSVWASVAGDTSLNGFPYTLPVTFEEI